MSQENVDVVRAQFAALGHGGLEAVTRFWHPDIEWRAIEGAADDVGLIEGRERLYRYYAEWLELFDDLHNDVLETHEVGELIVLRMRVTGRSRSAGVPVELDYALVVELCDGRIIRGREFATVDQALEAAANWG
jgi:ketosteroid isomerase-like protein